MRYIIGFCILFFSFSGTAQTSIYYSPVNISANEHGFYATMEPKKLAADLAYLLKKATGNSFDIKEYTAGASRGIFLLLDEMVRDSSNECGILETDNKSYIRIRGRYICGISYGMYSWLEELGFKFYLPGDEWTTIPTLKTIFTQSTRFKKYRPHFNLRFFSKSGGIFPIPGVDEHLTNDMEWITWYRRNRMGSGFIAIDGHMGETFNIANRQEIENDPSILAPVNGKRQYAESGKLDPTNKKGVALFSNWIMGEFKTRKKEWLGYLPLKKYFSVDPGDGLNYCHTPECEARFQSVSDQVFFVANQVAEKIKEADPNAGVSTFAYSERADTPSFKIEPNIHVQVVASAFQGVSTTAELVKRWAKKTSNISQYDYINIGIWTMDNPNFDLGRYHQYLMFVKKLGIQGFSYETSYSKFGSGIPQYFILQFLCTPYDALEKKLDIFCRDNFGKAAIFIKKLLKEWYFTEVHAQAQIDYPSFYEDEIGRFFYYLEQASGTTGLTDAEQARLRELKAYIIYLAKYYEIRTDLKVEKQAASDKNFYAQKVEDVLRYSWSLYRTKVFQNSQLNQMLVNNFLPEAFRQQWDYFINKQFPMLFSSKTAAEVVENEYHTLKKQYLPLANFTHELPATFFKTNAKHTADSFKLVTADETAISYFNYSLNIYAPQRGGIKIKCTTGARKAPGTGATAIFSLEKNDYTLMESRSVYRENADTTIFFNIPSAGFYKLYLGRFGNINQQYIIYPRGNFFYINKKTTLFNFLMLQDFSSNSPYPNKWLGLYVPAADSIAFSLINRHASNSFSFKFSDGSTTVVNSGREPFLLTVPVPVKKRNGFVFINNSIFRYSAVLKNIPPYYFFLKNNLR